MRRNLYWVLKFAFLFNVIKFTWAKEQKKSNCVPKPNFQIRNKYNRRIPTRATAHETLLPLSKVRLTQLRQPLR